MTTNQPDLALGVGVRTEQGRREENQDRMTAFSTPLGMFYIVADGMGGHRGGAEASRRVVEGYQHHLNSFVETAGVPDILQQATALTNKEILAESQSGDPAVSGMGSTVVMALLKSTPTGMEIMTAHIGDSRAYLLRNGTLHRLTRDHSAVQRMVDEHLITPEMASTHPDLNILTRAIGKQPDVSIEVGEPSALYPGDTLLLCTDGLWGHLSDERLAQELGVDRSAQDTAEALVQLALDAGSDDNITLQVLRLEDRNNPMPPDAPPPPAGPGKAAAAFQRGSTQPSAVFDESLRSSSALLSTTPKKKKPLLLLYGVATAICLCLAAGGGYLALRSWKMAHPKTQPPAPIFNNPCPSGQAPTASGVCGMAKAAPKTSGAAATAQHETVPGQPKGDATHGQGAAPHAAHGNKSEANGAASPPAPDAPVAHSKPSAQKKTDTQPKPNHDAGSIPNQPPPSPEGRGDLMALLRLTGPRRR